MIRKSVLALIVPVFAMLIAGCDVDVEDTGRLPDVDVEGGELPDVDVTTPDIDVGTEKMEITVPDIDVKTEKKEIQVPDVDVNIPQEDEQ